MKCIPETYECLFTQKELLIANEILGGVYNDKKLNNIIMSFINTDNRTFDDYEKTTQDFAKDIDIDFQSIQDKYELSTSQLSFAFNRLSSLINLIINKQIVDKLKIVKDEDYIDNDTFNKYIDQFRCLYSDNDLIINNYFINNSLKIINAFRKLDKTPDSAKEEMRHMIYRDISNKININEEDIKTGIYRLCLLEDLIKTKILFDSIIKK